MTNAIGLIAGEGNLPETIITGCMSLERPIFVISLAENAIHSPSLDMVSHQIIPISKVGKAIRFLKQSGVSELVFAGSVQRPTWSQLRPDASGIRLLSRISAAKMRGDDRLLCTVISFFESEGFTIVGADTVLKDLLMNQGTITLETPNEQAKKDIEYGVEVAHAIGQWDVGQAVVVQDGQIIGIEAAEGTDRLIKRCIELVSDGPIRPVLIKMKKPGQDPRIDLPTIGVTTIENIARAGFAGVALESEGTLLLDRKEVIARANAKRLFITGI